MPGEPRATDYMQFQSDPYHCSTSIASVEVPLTYTDTKLGLTSWQIHPNHVYIWGPDLTPNEVNGTFAINFNGNRMGFNVVTALKWCSSPSSAKDAGFSVSIAVVWGFFNLKQLYWLLAHIAGTAWRDQVGWFQQKLMKYQTQERPCDNSFTFFTFTAQASTCCTSAWVHPPGLQLLRPA